MKPKPINFSISKSFIKQKKYGKLEIDNREKDVIIIWNEQKVKRERERERERETIR